MVVAGGRWEEGIVWEFRMDTYTVLCLKQMTSKDLLYSTCSMLCCSLDGRGVWGKIDICIYMAEFLHCSPETITTLLISYEMKLLQS